MGRVTATLLLTLQAGVLVVPAVHAQTAAPAPLGRSTIPALDVSLDATFTDEQLLYYRAQTRLDADFQVLLIKLPDKCI